MTPASVQALLLEHSGVLRVNTLSLHNQWVHTLELLRNKADIAGINPSADPAMDLSWMACGYSQACHSYCEEQWFGDFAGEVADQGQRRAEAPPPAAGDG
jgi:hypothetical protein